MARKEIELLNNEIITEEQFEDIELNEHVESIECLGSSSQYPGYTWYSVEFCDDSIDVFLKIA